MTNPSIRVALIAQAGEAREQLKKALTGFGALIVIEGEPLELEPKQILQIAPNVVLLSLDANSDQTLDRFGAVLSSPDIEVMFDEAETTGRLEGWDLNRWARHLAAKLVGSDLLPPIPADAESLPPREVLLDQPGLPVTPAQLADAERLEDYAAEAGGLVDSVPTDRSLPSERYDMLGKPDDDAAQADLALLDSIDFDLSSDLPAQTQQIADRDGLSLDIQEYADTFTTNGLSLQGDMPMADELVSNSTISLSSEFSLDDDIQTSSDDMLELDDDLAKLSAQIDQQSELADRRQTLEPVSGLDFDKWNVEETIEVDAIEVTSPVINDKTIETAPMADKSSVKPSFGDLSLEPLNDAPAQASKRTVAPPPSPSFSSSLSLQTLDGEAQIVSNLPASTNATSHYVFVLAGLGGPDAVRQLLRALPATLSSCVLVYQHLDAGKHDRLVDQLGKISALPVYLANEGDSPRSSAVAILTAGLSVDPQTAKFSRLGSIEAMVNALPKAATTVVALSGADVMATQAALDGRHQGLKVLGQDPAACFEPSACQRIEQAGVAVLSPAVIAERIVAAAF